MKDRWVILTELCNKIGAKIVAEIGVSRGINASNWLRLCPQIQQMHLVDNYGGVFDWGLFTEDKIKLYLMDSQKAAEAVPNGLDLVFIDADHKYDAVQKDILVWL